MSDHTEAAVEAIGRANEASEDHDVPKQLAAALDAVNALTAAVERLERLVEGRR